MNSLNTLLVFLIKKTIANDTSEFKLSYYSFTKPEESKIAETVFVKDIVNEYERRNKTTSSADQPVENSVLKSSTSTTDSSATKSLEAEEEIELRDTNNADTILVTNNTDTILETNNADTILDNQETKISTLEKKIGNSQSYKPIFIKMKIEVENSDSGETAREVPINSRTLQREIRNHKIYKNNQERRVKENEDSVGEEIATRGLDYSDLYYRTLREELAMLRAYENKAFVNTEKEENGYEESGTLRAMKIEEPIESTNENRKLARKDTETEFVTVDLKKEHDVTEAGHSKRQLEQDVTEVTFSKRELEEDVTETKTSTINVRNNTKTATLVISPTEANVRVENSENDYTEGVIRTSRPVFTNRSRKITVKGFVAGLVCLLIVSVLGFFGIEYGYGGNLY